MSKVNKPDLDAHFPRYTEFDPLVPTWCVTPKTDGVTQRYYDTPAFSPSGRYMAMTHFRDENRLPKPGDVADILLVDLQTGDESILTATQGWDTQLGANVQWGADDTQLFFNDLDTSQWHPYGVKMNPFTGERQNLQGTVYMVSPDGNWIISPCLRRAKITQEGYGVVVPFEEIPLNRGAVEDDGVYITDAKTGASTLLISLKEVYEKAIPAEEKDLYREGDFYAAHVKWNAKSDRFLLVLRWLRWIDKPITDRRWDRVNLITVSRDASEVYVAIPHDEWGVKGGGHPGWHPDGDHVIMNLDIAGDGLRFVQARYDGTGLETLSDEVYGSGHPSLHEDGIHMLTDGYPNKQGAPNDGTNVVRLSNLQTGNDHEIVRIQNTPPFMGERRQFRVDVHPAWDHSFTRVSFNGCPDGTRRVYVADLSEFLSDPSR